MCLKPAGFAILALLISSLSGQPSTQQTSERVFHLAHTDGEQNFTEIATLLRFTADLPLASPDPTQKTITVRGTPEQIGLAEWLFHEIDKPQLPAPYNLETVSHQFVLAGGGENTVRLFYLSNSPSILDFQELATAVRTVADIRRVFAYNARQVFAVRGTADQIALATWMVNGLDQPTGKKAASLDYQLAPNLDPRGETAVRILYTANAETIQNFQEVATAMRTTADIRRVFTYNRPRAIIIRGTREQAALGSWLTEQLDKPAIRQPGTGTSQSSEPYEYIFDRDNTVRVFYLPNTASIQDFQNIATRIRTAANIRRVFTYNAPRAVAVRGTLDQVAAAERMIKDLDTPKSSQ